MKVPIGVHHHTVLVLIDLQDRTFSLHKERKYKPLASLSIPHTNKSGFIYFIFCDHQHQQLSPIDIGH